MARPGHLPPRLRRIYQFVGANPHGVTKAEIFDHLYGDDPDGGPLSGEHIVWVMIVYLNEKLCDCGLVVRKEFARKHMSPYQLRRIDNGNIWLPIQ